MSMLRRVPPPTGTRLLRKKTALPLFVSSALGFALLVYTPGVSGAQVARSPADLTLRSTNEVGLTVGELLDRNIWVLATHALSPDSLNSLSTDVHRPPRRGLQFELLTPGDFGATLHFRW
jgi:hypothetical protein